MLNTHFKCFIIVISCLLLLYALVHVSVIEKRTEEQERVWTSEDWKMIPIPSKTSGYYDAPFLLSFSSPDPNAEIRYTTDCSEPIADSILYVNAIQIKDRSKQENQYSLPDYSSDVKYGDKKVPVDKMSIIRAALFKEGKQISPVITLTYLVNSINQKILKELPLVSIVTNNDDLFDKDIGIYVHPLSNEEIEAHVDYFEDDLRFDFGQDVLLSIQGGVSRGHPQKGLNLTPDMSMGESTIRNVFDSVQVVPLSGWTVQAGFDHFKIRDAIASILGRHFLVEAFHYIPCNVFINGEYWGLYFIKEQFSNENLASLYHLKTDNVVVFKDYERKQGIRSDERLFSQLNEFYQTHDFSNDQAIEALDQLMSVDSLIDYCCLEAYVNNEDWPMHNIALWRARNQQPDNPFGDCRWRFVLYDTNYWNCMAYNSEASVLKLLATNQYCAPLFANKEFCKRFSKRMCDITNTVASYDYIEPQIENLSDQIKDSFPLSQSRIWAEPDRDFSYYSKQIKEFFYYRKDFVLDELEAAFQLGAPCPVAIVADVTKGEVRLNGIPIDLSYGSWLGEYYEGMKIRLDASDYQDFSGWRVSVAGEETLINTVSFEIAVPKEGMTILVE